MNLKKLRTEKGVSQVKLAEYLGIPQTNYSYYERHNVIPPKDILIKLADFYGVSTDKLLDIELMNETDDLIVFNVIGTIRAGYDGEAIEMATDEQIPIPKQFLKGYKRQDFMVLRVSGDSMYPKFLDGDYALIHRQSSVDSGSVACILYNGNDATIKTVRYVNGEDWLELIPTNPEYPTKRIEGADLQSCKVLGLVTKLIRDV